MLGCPASLVYCPGRTLEFVIHRTQTARASSTHAQGFGLTRLGGSTSSSSLLNQSLIIFERMRRQGMLVTYLVVVSSLAFSPYTALVARDCASSVVHCSAFSGWCFSLTLANVTGDAPVRAHSWGGLNTAPRVPQQLATATAGCCPAPAPALQVQESQQLQQQ